MRKIFKTAVSLVLSCALLSVSAFAIAPEESTLPGTRDDIATITVGNLGVDDQSTILVIKGDHTTIPANLSGTTQILYIDQMPAKDQVATYSVNFGEYIGVATVFAGGTSSNEAVKLGTISNSRATESVAISTEANGAAVEAVELFVGDTEELFAVLNPVDSNDWIEWSADDSGVVSVDEETGVVTALKVGTGVVTLTAGNAGDDKETEPRTATITFTVKDVPTAIEINGADDNQVVKVGETLQLTALLTPDTAGGVIVWSSNDPSLSVDQNGLVTVNAAGTATITATVTAGDVTYTDTIVLVAEDEEEPGSSLPAGTVITIRNANPYGLTGYSVVTITGITSGSVKVKDADDNEVEAYLADYSAEAASGGVCKYIALVKGTDFEPADIVYDANGTATNIVFGDVAGNDNQSTITDANQIVRYVIKSANADTDYLKLAADVNGDGSISIADANETIRYVVKSIKVYSVAK